MRWGVTYAALIFNLVFTLELFLATRNLLALLLALPIHGISALLCAHDARFFDLLLLWARTRFLTLLGNGPVLEGLELQPVGVLDWAAATSAAGADRVHRRGPRGSASEMTLRSAARIRRERHCSSSRAVPRACLGTHHQYACRRLPPGIQAGRSGI